MINTVRLSMIMFKYAIAHTSKIDEGAKNF
jgi:hypothetical protein